MPLSVDRKRVRLADIVSDAGTQIRASISESVVADYAEQMAGGAEFPPVVLFHDGNQYYMADGFHRVLACERNQFREINAEVRKGTKTDALWYALGANRTNAHRLTSNDKRHAILMALNTWNGEKSNRQIADQVGCSDVWVGKVKNRVRTSSHLNRVTGKDGKGYNASRAVTEQKRAEIADRIRAGKSQREICAELHVGANTITQVRKKEKLFAKNTRGSKNDRLDTMGRMAAQGYSSPQIANEVGVTVERCRRSMRDAGIDVPADVSLGKRRKHNANQIVEHIVMDAENLTADIDLIDFSSLDVTKVVGWVASLNTSRRALGTFIRRLSQENPRHEQTHEEAA